MPNERIWIIAKYATPDKYPRHFGIGKHLASTGADVTLITSVSNSAAVGYTPSFKGWSKTEDHQGLKVLWMNGPAIKNTGLTRIYSWFLFEMKVMLTMIFAKKPDVILSSSLSLLSVYSGIILSKRFRSKFLFEVRDIWPLSLIELGGFSSKNLLVRFLAYTEKLGYKHAKTIIGTMPNLKAHVQNVSPKHADKVVCVPQGAYLELFEEQSEKLPDDFVKQYIPEQKFIIAYTGTLNANNPIQSLIDVARQFDSKKEQYHFLILGEGNQKSKYIEECKELSNISFPPTIAKAQMAHFLSHVEIGYDAFSSTLAEFGLSRNKWIDYMYNRCIVLCSYDGFQSMINEAQSGFFVPYEDNAALAKQIEMVYDMSPEARSKMKESGRNFILDNRTFDKLGDQYLKAFAG